MPNIKSAKKRVKAVSYTHLDVYKRQQRAGERVLSGFFV